MYRYTVTNVKDAGELQPPAVGYTLVETQYAPPDRLIVVWMAGYDYEVEWGDTTWAKADAPVIEAAD